MPASVYIGSKSYPFALLGSSLSGGKNLITFNVPAGVVANGYLAGTFSGCDNLRYINIASAHETLSSLDGVVYDKSGKRLVFVPNAMTEFTVPAGVTNVLEDAFMNCNGLAAIDVEDGNGYYASVDGVLYNKAMTALIRWPRGKDDVSILDTVTSIGVGAFRMCTNLTEVILPEGVGNIADSAFAGCSGLTELELPASVTNIGSSAFSGCTALTEIEFPESISNIRDYTFDGCTGLSRVVLPSTITNLDYRAFSGCSGVRSVTVPQSICSTNRLATIFPAAYSRITDVVIAEGTTVVGDNLFSGCVNLVDLVVPDSVTSISSNAFKNCDKFNANLYLRQLKGVFGPDAETGVRYSLGEIAATQ